MTKGTIENVATASQLQARIAALRQVPLPEVTADILAVLEPLAAALEAFEAHELALGVRLITPAVQVWH